MTTSGAHHLEPAVPVRRCPECGDVVINWGAHAERCYGPPPGRECGCAPGWMHDPDCPEVTGGEAA